jgi:hypothetical protein
MLRQRDDARAAVTIAARAAHVAQGNADGCFRVAAFHAQVLSQLSHAITSQWFLETSAALILGQNHE